MLKAVLMLSATMLATIAIAAETVPPLPPPRPDRPPDAAHEAPNNQPPSSEASTQQKSPEEAKAEADCLERLTHLGLRFEPRPAVQEGACTVQNPVLVSALPNGIEVSPASLMRCPFAESLTRWMSDVVVVEADRHLQSKPKKVLIGTSYQCRDQRSGSKLSEHAFGNGVDVMGFEFEKRTPLRIGAQPEGSAEAEFQSALQKGSCSTFTTVLGPGADDDHGDHLHLDMRARKGDYRICQ